MSMTGDKTSTMAILAILCLAGIFLSKGDCRLQIVQKTPSSRTLSTQHRMVQHMILKCGSWVRRMCESASLSNRCFRYTWHSSRRKRSLSEDFELLWLASETKEVLPDEYEESPSSRRGVKNGELDRSENSQSPGRRVRYGQSDQSESIQPQRKGIKESQSDENGRGQGSSKKLKMSHSEEHGKGQSPRKGIKKKASEEIVKGQSLRRAPKKWAPRWRVRVHANCRTCRHCW